MLGNAGHSGFPKRQRSSLPVAFGSNPESVLRRTEDNERIFQSFERARTVVIIVGHRMVTGPPSRHLHRQHLSS